MARYLQKFSHVRRFLKIAFVLFALLSCGRLRAQPAGYDVFVPISKYMAQGNADNLSAWFDDNLEIAVVSQGSNASKAQAKQIVKAFFENYTPRSFEVNHTAGRDNMKYALGTLKAGGENFSVTIFVSSKGKTYKIQQLKIERL